MLRQARKVVVRTVLGGSAVLMAVEWSTGLPSQGLASEWYHHVVDEEVTPRMRAWLDPETAHQYALWFAQHGLSPIRTRPKQRYQQQQGQLSSEVFGVTYPNPIGLAAGFDKNGVAIGALQRMGFGFVEIGSVTPLPQEGNPKPRMFRIPQEFAIINRYAFNNDGIDAVSENLQTYRNEQQQINNDDDTSYVASLWSMVVRQVWWWLFRPYRYRASTVVGVNLGKNKTSVEAPDEIADYVAGVRAFAAHADYLVINISSPNTPNLRDWQQPESLRLLLRAVLDARDEQARRVPILVKLAPDLSTTQLQDIATTVMTLGVDGLVVSNTTKQRTLSSSSQEENGGLSGGAFVREISTECIRVLYAHTKGEIPIVGVGGVSNAHHVMEKLKAGASLVQIYSVLVYEGPGVVSRILDELPLLLKQEGFRNVQDAIGYDHQELYWAKKQKQLQLQLQSNQDGERTIVTEDVELLTQV